MLEIERKVTKYLLYTGGLTLRILKLPIHTFKVDIKIYSSDQGSDTLNSRARNSYITDECTLLTTSRSFRLSHVNFLPQKRAHSLSTWHRTNNIVSDFASNYIDHGRTSQSPRKNFFKASLARSLAAAGASYTLIRRGCNLRFSLSLALSLCASFYRGATWQTRAATLVTH